MKVRPVAGSTPESLEAAENVLAGLRLSEVDSEVATSSASEEEHSESKYDAPAHSGDPRISSGDSSPAMPSTSEDEDWENYRRELAVRERRRNEKDVNKRAGRPLDDSSRKTPAIGGERVALGPVAPEKPVVQTTGAEANREEEEEKEDVTGGAARPRSKAVKWPKVQTERFPRRAPRGNDTWEQRWDSICAVTSNRCRAYVDEMRHSGLQLPYLAQVYGHTLKLKPVAPEDRPYLQGDEGVLADVTLDEYMADPPLILELRIVRVFHDLGRRGVCEKGLVDRALDAIRDALTTTPLMNKHVVAFLNEASGQTMSEASWRAVKDPSVFKWFWEDGPVGGMLPADTRVEQQIDFVSYFTTMFTHNTRSQVYAAAVDSILADEDFLRTAASGIDEGKSELNRVAVLRIDHKVAEWVKSVRQGRKRNLSPTVLSDTVTHLNNQILLRCLMHRLGRQGGKATGTVGSGSVSTVVPFRFAGPLGLPPPEAR
jgi:hypothetical protein